MLLEGQTVHLPAPKSHYAEDIVFERDVPIFYTGKDELVYVRGGVADLRETDAVFTFKRLLRFKLTEVKLTEPK